MKKEPAQDVQALIEALREARDEYERRKPLAWTAARAALESAPAVQPAEPLTRGRKLLHEAIDGLSESQVADVAQLILNADAPPAAVPARFRWNRELTSAEVAAVSANPWQMFDPAVPAQPAESAEPVAWRCKDFADGWAIFTNESLARVYQTQTGLSDASSLRRPSECERR